MGVPAVSGLIYYPVKGCAGVPVPAATVTSTGIVSDRSLMLVDEDGAFLSQRKTPAMAVIRPTLAEGGTRLVLVAPGTDDAEFDILADGDRRPVSLFNRWFGTGIDQGDAVGDEVTVRRWG